MDANDTAMPEEGQTSGASEAEDAPRSVAIRAQVAERVTFATQQCDVAVIADLVVSNRLGTDLENLTLRVAAEPKVIGERTWRIDRIAAGSELRLHDRRVSLAGGMFEALTERMRAEVSFELFQAEALLAESRHAIVALAHNEWGGARFMPELLAAFIMPNDPAVARLLKEASRLLEASGKTGSFEGYQARSRKRSWEMVSAIWAAVSRRRLTYAEPPTSFEQQGQKVRLPSMIEEQGLATCLDTALLFAASIELAGLYPIVVFTKGHALVGAWLQPQTLPSLTVDDPVEIRKAIAQEELVLFETTMATGSQCLPFSRAIAEGARQVSEAHEDAFVYALDVRQARGRDIQPLPVRAAPGASPSAGAEAEADTAAPLDEAPDLPPFDVGADADETAEQGPESPAQRLERWKRSLLDLSKHNRLLNLKASATAIPIFCPDPARLEDKIAENRSIRLIPPPERRGATGQPDADLYHLRTGEDFAVKFAEEALGRDQIVANVDPKTLEKGVIELYRKAKADLEEGGSNTLFLALGMLRWSPAGDKRVYRAPLILLPVKLERSSAASKPYLRKHEDDPVFNLTLLQMLRQDFQVAINGLSGELPGDDHGVDVRKIWDMVRARIRTVPGFEVVEDVVLSTFSFAKYLMWKDLSDRTETLKASPFVRHVIDTPRDAYRSGASFLDPAALDRTVAPGEIMAPLNADSSQTVAILASGQGGDFVLEGPPGTGKSETIANIIAHNIGLGRRVLFVSEKMAALEVVYRRLHGSGLGDFCLELHSTKANKRAVLDQLGAAFGRRAEHSAKEWDRKATWLAEAREALNGLVDALHKPGPARLSPREAIGRAVRCGDMHRLRLDWPRDDRGHGFAPTPEALRHLEEVAKRLGQQFSQLQPEDVEAFRHVAHSDWSFAWLEKIVAAAGGLHAAIEDLVRDHRAFAERLGLADIGEYPEEIAAFAEIAALVPECARFDLGFALGPGGRDRIDLLEELLRRLDHYRTTRARLPAAYPPERIVAAPLAEWLSEHRAAEKKIWPARGRAERRLRNAIWDGLGVDPARAAAPERDLPVLIELAEQLARLDVLAQALPEDSPWSGLDTDADMAAQALQSGRNLRAAVTRLSNLGQDPAICERIGRALCEDRERLEGGMPAARAAAALVEAHPAFLACLHRFRAAAGPVEAEALADESLDALAKTAAGIIARGPRLNVWCAWVGISRDAREAGLGALVAALEAGAVAHDQTVEALRTAYACWLAPILIDARPALKRFSSVRHEDLIRTFRDLDRELAELSAAYIRAKLSACAPAQDGGAASQGYGVLTHELQKRTRHKPVRQLVADMGEALTALTPCLMMSPLSVAQFLPAGMQLFDLVVFDEASQITVPDAIGAIARGRHCIVVGDPKQMPPTRFFERGAEDDENEETRDLESILGEAMACRVPHYRLTGHYRSRHESLICFSNHAYYQGSLITYPAADTRETAVTFRRVNGVYAKGRSRTNEIEAKAVVADVVSRLRDPKRNHLSIGVVTLNAEQQRLVEDLLDQERRADPDIERFFRVSDTTTQGDRTEPVFVKNLETVQGDQRDVILLSVGYGPTEPGAKTMSMNFGPLNRQGGERRLNVAITRATSEVVVFASFDASMIDLSRTSSEAVKDLKHYIDFAARGPVALGEAIRAVGTGDYESDFELAVAERLRGLGWMVRTQIGVSRYRIDLGIVHPDAPGGFLAGIECDGATYHSAPSARDRDRVRHIVLEQLGWKLLRIWSTDFFLDEQTSVAKLDANLRHMLEEDRKKAAEASAEAEARAEAEAAAAEEVDAAEARRAEPATAEARVESDPGAAHGSEKEDHGRYQPRDGEALRPWAAEAARRPQVETANMGPATLEPAAVPPVPQQVARAPRSAEGVAEPDPASPNLARFHDPSYLPQLKAMAAEIIDAEGPITLKRLSDRIARAHGFERTGKQIKGTVWDACKRIRRYVTTPDEHKVFWPEGVPPQTTVPFRGLLLAGERREWKEVPHPEKLWLVREILRDGRSDPARAVAEAIGFGRITTQFRAEIAELIGCATET